MIVIPIGTTQSHIKFIEWVNSEIESPTVGFWSDLISDIANRLMTAKTVLFLQEFYKEDRITQDGFSIFSGLGTTNQKMYYFDPNSVPIYYSDGNTNPVLNILSTGQLSEFNVGIYVNLKDSTDTIVKKFGIELHKNWGVKFPFMKVRSIGSPIETRGYGLLDVGYADKESSSYYIYVEPDANAVKYRVENISGQDLDLSVPYYANYEVTLILEKDTTEYVFKTPRSEYYLRQLVEEKLVRITEPVV